MDKSSINYTVSQKVGASYGRVWQSLVIGSERSGRRARPRVRFRKINTAEKLNTFRRLKSLIIFEP